MYRAAEPEWPVYENKSFEGGLPFKGPVLKVHQQRMHSGACQNTCMTGPALEPYRVGGLIDVYSTGAGRGRHLCTVPALHHQDVVFPLTAASSHPALHSSRASERSSRAVPANHLPYAAARSTLPTALTIRLHCPGGGPH